MALQKTPVPINFAKGVDTKSDPFQLPLDSFLEMQNSVFTTSGRLTKRNGFPIVTTLPNKNQTIITTLNDNLITTGTNLYALSQDTNQWLNQGTVQPIRLDTIPLVRISTNQVSPDVAVAASGLTCLTYVDTSTSGAYVTVIDSATGQRILPIRQLPSTATSPRVFLLGNYFIVTFLVTVSGATHLRYMAIPISNPSSIGTAVDFNTITPTARSLTCGYDGYVINNTLYMAWAGTGTTIKIASLTSGLIQSTAASVASHTAELVSVTVDNTILSQPVVWISFWDTTSFGSAANAYTMAYNSALSVQLLAPTLFASSVVMQTLTTAAANGTNNLFYEILNNYSSTGAYPTANVQTDYVEKNIVTQSGTVGTPSVMLRSVGLGSKAFIDTTGIIYMLVTYGESNHDLASPGPDQNTYFLVDSSGNIYMRLAYSNGGGYAASQVLPTVSLVNNTYYVPYLNNDLISAVNKTTNAAVPINAIYTQTGVNLAKFSINDSGQHSSEIAGSLLLTGGQVWQYDGVTPVELGFHVWPDNVAGATTTGSGSVAAGTYFYQFTYEWTDSQGNLHRSAPSVPIELTTTTASSTNTLYVPTLRLTYKLSPNPIRIVGYRWSVAQLEYYQFTSLTNPTINDPTVDYVTFTDTLADPSIVGNNLIYTSGGVLEDIAPPACIDSALFNNRLVIIDAEDQNLLWFSKQVIESTPVEMSDALTIYVAPTTGAQGSTGAMTAIFPMDDKLIIFKRDAIYYINGIGPDNTGSNSTFSDPVFITGAVGCSNPNSIVLTPNGLMFQSDKGIWQLGRGLDTTYIGAPVENYNAQTVNNAQTIPGTTQTRFVLDNNITLMYDYFFDQWGTFTNILAISATLWQGKHTYLNSVGQVLQEAQGTYVDGSVPVLMSLTSAWINLAGLQGFERFYASNLLGTYITPFKLNVQYAYNYNPSPSQATIVTPDNFGGAWGAVPVYGAGTNWGNSEGNVFTARIFPQIQKCQSFQVSIQELYDPSMGQAAGAGLTLSGMVLLVGIKRGTRTQSAAKSFG